MIRTSNILQNIIKASVNGVLLTSLMFGAAQAETVEEVLAKANKTEAEINKMADRQKEISQRLSDIETKYQKELALPKAEGVEAYDAKIAAAKAQKAKNVDEKDNVTEKTSSEDSKKTVNKTETTQTKENSSNKKTIDYPWQRSPRYVAPQKASKGRRPFTRSDNEQIKENLYYASRKNSETISFAKEEAVQAYTGTTEENVFIFSDNLANYCKFDTQSLDKMQDCLNQLIKERSSGSQGLTQQINELYQESLIDSTAHAIADAARFKNDSSDYEKNVLLPLQEKSSQATDERGDIEVLTLAEMEAIKLQNKVMQLYATQLGLDAFRDYGTFEVNNRDLTDIDNKG